MAFGLHPWDEPVKDENQELRLVQPNMVTRAIYTTPTLAIIITTQMTTNVAMQQLED